MDPFTVAMLSSAAGDLLASGVGRAVRVIGREDQSEFDIDYTTEVTDGEDQVIGVLSKNQLEAVNELLNSDALEPLLEARALGRIVLTPQIQRQQGEELSRLFTSAAAKALAKLDIDDSMLDQVWDLLDRQLGRLIQINRLGEALTPLERSSLAGLEHSLKTDRDRTARVPRWLASLANLAADPDALVRTRIFGDEIRRRVVQTFSTMELRHSPDGGAGRSLSSLYIHRTLLNPDGNEVRTDELFDNSMRLRVVVTGHPGVGKSTLTQHLMARFSEDHELPVPLLLRAREANLEAPLLLGELSEAVRREYQEPDVVDPDVAALLTLGQAFVIFDGIDEIVDGGLRRGFVSKIEAFAERYPLCSILVTSREDGYLDAPLKSPPFDRMKLRPFDRAQVSDYLDKWFGRAAEGKKLIAAFERDAESVASLTRNPLMLSLLCILYKNRGYIPRNRRQVYRDCADLLFRRWDSMRQIAQPTDHVEHGEDLMEEIAMFFFKSRSARGGVQERQLTGIIAHYLQDSAGVLEASARHRAKEFLQFCSTRAWLLAVSGTQAGERLFSFTHQTFMEYFAAEGLARTEDDPDELAKIMIEQYQRNAASVVPDLIVVAAEAGRRGRARDILEKIRERERLIGTRGGGRFLPLRMRIASVLNMQPKHFDLLIAEAFERLDQEWDEYSREIYEGVFALPRNARERVEAFLLRPEDIGQLVTKQALEERQRILLRCWVVHELRTGENPASHEWGDLIEACWEAQTNPRVPNDKVLRYYARFFRGVDITFKSDEIGWSFVEPHGSFLPGPYAVAVLRNLENPGARQYDDILEHFNGLTAPPRLGYGPARELARELLSTLERMRTPVAPVRLVALKATLAAVMVWWEVNGDDDDMVEAFESIIGVRIDILGAKRQESRTDGELEISTPAVLPSTFRRLRDQTAASQGRWVKRWADMELSFISDELSRPAMRQPLPRPPMPPRSR